jgi:hypothetical protein
MAKEKTLKVSFGTWQKLKLQAVTDGVTMRELAERLIHHGLSSPATQAVDFTASPMQDIKRTPVPAISSHELVYSRDE